MKIGIIGAADLGQTVARRLSGAGYEVVLANSRGPDTLVGLVAGLGPGVSAGTVEEVAALDIVVLAVPWTRVEDVLTRLPEWNGRILIDATNAFLSYAPDFRLAELGGKTSSEIVAGFAKGARVVKSLNTLDFKRLAADPAERNGRRVLFLSGDDSGAKHDVTTIIEELGFAAIDLGGLVDGGRVQQVGGPLAGLDLLSVG